MDKYYTPTIEEFCIGFEYELRHPVLVDKGWVHVYEDQWTKEIFTQRDFERGFGWDRRRDIEEHLIRVKYLDKEDIESLGFKYYGTRDSHTRNGVEESGFLKKLEDDSNVYIKCFLDKDSIVESDLDIQSTDIYTYDTSTPWDAYCEGGCGPSAQQIVIKNKSELKILLKQLGIS